MLRNACFFALFAVAGLMFGAGGAFAHSNHHHAPAEVQMHDVPLTAATSAAVEVIGTAAAGDWLQATELPANPVCPWQHCPDCGACCGCGASGGAALSQFVALAYPSAIRERRVFVPVRAATRQAPDDLARPPKSFA